MTFEQNQLSKTYSKKKLEQKTCTIQARFETEGEISIVAATCNAVAKAGETSSVETKAICNALFCLAYETAENKFVSETKTSASEEMFGSNDMSNIIFEAKVVDIKTEQLPNEVILTALVEVAEFGLDFTEVATLRPGTEGAIELTKLMQIQTLSAVADDKIVVVDESEIASSNVLCTESAVVLSKLTPAEDSIVAEGTLFVNILSEIDGNLKFVQKNVDFSSEIAAIGIKNTSKIDAFAQIETCVVTIADTNSNSNLTISATIKFNAYCFDSTDLIVVEDAFSEDKELVVTSTGLERNIFESKTFETKNIDTKICSKEKLSNIGVVVAVLNPKILDSLKGSLIEATVVYRDAETDQICSCKMQGNLDLDTTNVENVFVQSFSKKKNKDIELELLATKTNETEQTLYDVFATQIEESGDAEKDNHSIVVYSAKSGQTLFEIAKTLKVSPDTLKTQNEDLGDIFEQDRKIVYYKKLN